MTDTKPTQVLFLCTGNSCRSQMAEGLMRALGGTRFEVFSAGLELHGVHPLTIAVMEEAGYAMSGHRSKHLNEFLGDPTFDYLITVCGDADERCPTFPGMGTRLHWGFEDPAKYQGTEEEKLARFRETRDLIKARLQSWLAEINSED